MTTSPGRVEIGTAEGPPREIIIRVSGNWSLEDGATEAGRVREEIGRFGTANRVRFESGLLGQWGTGLVLFVTRVRETARRLDMEAVTDGLPQGLRQILATTALPGSSGTDRDKPGTNEPRSRIPAAFRRLRVSTGRMVAFLGEVTMALFRLVAGRSRLRAADLLLVMQSSGIEAVPIVSLISLLVGLIFAFVGAIQLKLFGAQIYVADLVGIAMARAMGAVMTGIIMAGRTGASFAAQIGTMQTNEEIDALTTTGISPVDFLVLPRVLGLTLMMPLLTLYADFMGFLGGMIVGVGLLGFDVSQYYNQTKTAVGLTNVWIGLFMGLVFGALVGLAGTFRGMECGRNALAVGEATTSAVVTSIVSIIVATAIITVLLNILGI